MERKDRLEPSLGHPAPTCSVITVGTTRAGAGSCAACVVGGYR